MIRINSVRASRAAEDQLRAHGDPSDPCSCAMCNLARAYFDARGLSQPPETTARPKVYG